MPEVVTKSQRLLNYAKAFGAVATALAALGALIVSTYTAIKPPEEPVAKATYETLKKKVEALTDDVTQAAKERLDVVESCENQVAQLGERMRDYLSGYNTAVAMLSGKLKQNTPDTTTQSRINKNLLKLLTKPKVQVQRKKYEKPKSQKMKLETYKRIQQRVFKK